MADKKDKPLLPNKSPKGNYQIWVIMISIAVIFGIFYLNTFSDLPEKTYDEFVQMVRSNDVSKVLLIKNQDIVEITLRPEALQNAKYKQELEQSPLGVSPKGPHFKVKIVSPDRFDVQFGELRNKDSNAGKIEYDATNRETRRFRQNGSVRVDSGSAKAHRRARSVVRDQVFRVVARQVVPAPQCLDTAGGRVGEQFHGAGGPPRR